MLLLEPCHTPLPLSDRDAEESQRRDSRVRSAESERGGSSIILPILVGVSVRKRAHLADVESLTCGESTSLQLFEQPLHSRDRTLENCHGTPERWRRMAVAAA